MICDDICYVINESPQAHGVFEHHQEAPQRLFCEVRSVTRAEFWRAQQNGLEPAYVLRISEWADYAGQKLLLFRGKRWRVLRSYVDGHAVELTIAPATVDADNPPEREVDGDA